MTAEQPLDPRYLRFQGIVVATVVLTGFVFRGDWVLPVLAFSLAAAGLGGRRANIFFFVYDVMVSPRLTPPTADEDEGLVRFTTLFAASVLVLATGLLAVGLGGMGWAFALLLAVVEAVSALAAIPLGRALYERYRSRRR